MTIYTVYDEKTYLKMLNGNTIDFAFDTFGFHSGMYIIKIETGGMMLAKKNVCERLNGISS